MNSLKLGDYILLKKQYPCKVIEINKSAPGKHGHAQYNVVGRDVITDKKYNELFKHHDHYTTVEVLKRNYMGMSIDDDGFLSMFDDDMSERTDLQLKDDEMRKAVREFEETAGEFTVEMVKVIMPDKSVRERVLKITKYQS